MRLIALLLFAGIVLLSAGRQDEKKWDTVTIAPDLPADTVYRRMDREFDKPQVFRALPYKPLSSTLPVKPPPEKRSCAVDYRSGPVGMTHSPGGDEFNCHAYLGRSGKLGIAISYEPDGYSWGFRINYSEEKFYTEPFEYSDVLRPKESESLYQVIYQQLTLNKRSYSVGDSVYGKINFKSIEHRRPSGDVVEHLGTGYFRAKITAPGF